MYRITLIYYLDFIHRLMFLQSQRFKGWFFPGHQVNLLSPIEASSIDRTQQSGFT
jgi:hypothetical protein